MSYKLLYIAHTPVQMVALGKDFTFRASGQLQRLIWSIYEMEGRGTSDTVNKAIEETPDEYLQRKPVQVHVQLSGSAVKKLNKASKKYKLSDATLVERALDYYWRKAMIEQIKKLSDKIDTLKDEGERPFHWKVESDTVRLLEIAMPKMIKYAPNKPTFAAASGWFATGLGST